jgi:hypothetical protein
MRFVTPAVLSAFAMKGCMADWMAAGTSYDCIGGGCETVFHTDFGAYNVDASDGCQSTSVPGMVEFCIDWANARGHFRFSHQPFKRCLRLVYDRGIPCGGGGICYRSEW